jgi:4-amino-4-deoxy-L-arabinose transferase-like glycosyltransferase
MGERHMTAPGPPVAGQGHLDVPLTPRRGLVAAGLLAWLFLVIGAYYVVHKPFGLPQLSAAGQALLDVALWIGVLGIAAGVGLRLVGLWPGLEAGERLVFGLGLGMAALGYGVMMLGWAGLLRPLWVAVLGFGLFVWQLVRPQPLKEAWQTARAAVPRPVGRFEWLLAASAVFCLALALAWALAPPYAFDAAVYHLRQVNIYLVEHSLFIAVDSAYAGFPGLMQMLFAFTLALGGDSAPQLIHFTFLPLTILAAAALGRRLWSLELTWPVAALLTAVPTLLLVAAWPYVDGALMFYTLLLFFALALWLQDGRTRSTRWLVLAGVLCGIATETKYTALWYPLAGAVLIVLRARRDGWRTTLGGLALFGAVTLLVAAPWYLRNWLLTGNPVYPYLWGGPAWDPGRSAWWDRPGTGLAAQPLRLLAAPWEMAVLGSEGKVGYSATLGPLLLALVPGLIAVWRHLSADDRRSLGWMGLFGGVLYAVWLWGVARSGLLMQSRLLLPIFPLLALAAALVLQLLRVLDTRALSLSWLVKATVALVLALNAVMLSTNLVQDRPLAPLLGVESRADYLARHTGTAYVAAMQHVNDLPAGSKTFFLWEPRTYHCQKACLPDSLYDNLVYLVRQHGTAAGIAQAFASLGVTHVLLNRAIMDVAVKEGGDPISAGDLHVWDDLQAGYLRPVYEDGVMYGLFEVRR